MSSFYDKKKLEETHKKVRENATPSQLSIMNMVDEEFEKQSKEFANSIDAENEVRLIASNILGIKTSKINIAASRELLSLIKKTDNQTVFQFRGIVLYKTVFGTVDRVDRYIKVLEATTIDITNNSQFTPLGTFDLFKLAFKKLFGGK